MRFAVVAVGGALGVLARYLLQSWILDRTGPSIIALFVVNVSGAFAIGVVLTLAQERNLIGPTVRLFLTTGFLGGYTTFSSWMYDSVQLLQAGSVGRAALNVIGSAVAGIAAVSLGIVVARLI